MNLTLSVDKQIVQKARKAAESMGTSLNQLIRDFLVEIAGGRSASADIRELMELSSRSDGHSKDWKFDRDEIHERS